MTETERENTKEALPASKKCDNTGEVLKPAIKLEVAAPNIAFGNGEARIKTDAFEVRVPLEIRIQIKEILTRLGSKGLIPEGRFIPYCLTQLVGMNAQKQMIRMQNDFLADFRVIPVFGLIPAALAHEIVICNADQTETRTTMGRFITSQPNIQGVKLTSSTADLGKVFLKTDAANVLQARAFVDDVIKKLYESGSIPIELILPNFNPPRHGDAPRANSALTYLGNPQEEDSDTSHNRAPPPRRPRRNLNIIYDLTGNFPNLPQQHGQTQRAPQQPPNNPQHAQSQASASALTQDTMAKFCADLKKKFTEMIRNEVKTQIQQEMTAMQEAMTTVSTKLDAMQGSTRDAIGSAIKESMQGLTQYTQHQEHPQATHQQYQQRIQQQQYQQPAQ
jgi:hypothetical protein